ncbi:MAG: tRNA (adenosine(37)-N6)-threonylcarbamoyltransferase complex ATPase subunit type 1 TsaE [Hyphomicrobiales bacterium]|nr:tRNA (adenosine(37)-N6)-threonylcarbamoyltransferase complex ATPase subunit type 1 TsaE [Hyphomicrobiales bacterium]MCP5370392.1 tRNA (adenosine(37)-N6)-threonylcarbamoyltransferase complex ATPase subunit type 1 TsaE [Hyphomicrobiales bacterium]
MDSSDQITIDLRDEAATARLAQSLARVARVRDVIALRGDLGAGKTALARAFIRALGDPDEEVPSPTFTLVQHYDTDAGPVVHFDFYRLNTAEEAYELGLEDAFAEGISLIEWPERVPGLLPRDRLDVTLAIRGKRARRAVLAGGNSWMERLRSAGHA